MSTIEREIVGNVIYIHHHAVRAERPPRPRRRRVSSAADSTRLAGTVDDELVERVVMGDVVAAERLKRRHHEHLVALAMHVLRHEDEAVAAVEAAFEDACSGWPPQRGQVKAWLKRLVRRRAWALRRAQLDRP